ncbi:MAG TPA: hypothetical protein VER17_10490 [Tepidisphaeraceae bacterium]|nr:hypothetical protein [Tepidisphaeraceae bacterium]
MTLLSDVAERQRIASLAQRALDKRQPSQYRVDVDSDNVLHEDDWYQVLVKTPGDVRTYEFYDVLANAEAELQDEQGLQILLVPVVGD